MERYPELEEATGERSYLFLTSKTIDGEDRQHETERIMTKIRTDCSEGDAMDKLRTMRDYVLENGRNKVALYSTGDNSRGDIFRRMVECVFEGTPIACQVYSLDKAKREVQHNAVVLGRGAKRTSSCCTL